jgi:hypothetical protein
MFTSQSRKRWTVNVLFMAGLTAALFALRMRLAQVNCDGMAYLENRLACAMYSYFALGLALLTLLALLAVAIPLVSRQVSYARLGTFLLLPMTIVLFSEVVSLVSVDCEGDAYYVNEFYCEGRLLLACLIPVAMGAIAALAGVIGKYCREFRQSVNTTS